jgi:hypothetical protein
MQTLQELIQDLGITATSTRVDRNPNMDDSENMDHWRVALKYKDGGIQTVRMSVYFSKGSGHKGAEPTAEEVLDCMASDAAGVENAQSFDDWCSEYGYDTDSRKALRTFNTCKRQGERLRRFLGVSAYNDLLWETERL